MNNLAILMFLSIFNQNFSDKELLDLPISYDMDDCIDFVLIDIDERELCY